MILQDQTRKNGKIERHEARLFAKSYTKKDGIDYDETFSPACKKESLRKILALVAQYDLELHQMDVKVTYFFSNMGWGIVNWSVIRFNSYL